MPAPPVVAPPKDDIDSSSNGFQIHNGNNIACTVQLAGGTPVVVQPNKWSPKFTADGRYNAFIADSLIQFTVDYNGGVVEISPGLGGGNYVVWTTII